MKTVAFLTALGFSLCAPLAEAADIRLKVKNATLGSKRQGDTRTSQRRLVIEIDNRDREAYDGVRMEWVVIGRDIRNRKLSIVSSGSKLVDLPVTIVVDSIAYFLGRLGCIAIAKTIARAHSYAGTCSKVIGDFTRRSQT